MAEQRLNDRYRLIQRVLIGDSARGIPELWLAQDAGDSYFAKLWKREPGNTAIQSLWNREVRSLSRLQGYPGAAEIFVRLQDLGQTDKHFYAILDGGRSNLLGKILKDRPHYAWLTNLGEAGRRRLLWEGLLRVAEALSILHGEGTLHRSLSSNAVFTSPTGAADFRLSGFEWSLRIAGSDGAESKVSQAYPVRAPELDGAKAEYSMATDWFDFGLLAAEVLGVSIATYKKRDTVRSAIRSMSQLREGEKAALLHFLEEDAEQRVGSGEAATQYVRNIVRELSSTATGATRSLILAVRLGDRDISRTIQDVSNKRASANDPQAQLQWIQHDLRGDLRVVARTYPHEHFVLKGEKLEYRVQKWEVDKAETWEIGYCETLEPKPKTTNDDQFYTLRDRSLEIALYPTVRRAPLRFRDRAAVWDRVFAFRKSRAHIAANLRDVHDFFRVTQQLETILTAAQICPVRVLTCEKYDNGTSVVVTPAEEGKRNDLALALRLPKPSEQLSDWFDLGVEEIAVDDEQDPNQDDYQLLTNRTIKTDPGTNVDWRLVSASSTTSGPKYVFQTQSNITIREGQLYYLARNHGGTIAQIRRRYKAIEDMRTHEDLLRLLADPRAFSRRTGEALPPERLKINLDSSKISALEKLWQTQPSFAIQGPPGTGKTTLIRAFADRLLARDAAAQILVSAHSHHTVDDVLDKLFKQFQQIELKKRPILVRIGARNETNCDVSKITAELLGRLQTSQIAHSSPTRLQHRIQSALKLDRNEAASADFRTMQLLVQDSANITFTTSNAADLEELGSRGRRFDWSIIEEAGKAHGFDMAAALQSSHRLLLIGDHFQLPPFNARLYKELLSEPLRIRKAMHIGVEFAPGLIDSSVVDDDDEREEFQERCAKWRRMVDLFAVIFQQSIADGGDDAPAVTLTDQHRMHPDIAAIVGKSFYPDGNGGSLLRSPPETQEHFKQDPPYLIRQGSWLPSNRVVWRNVDWVSRTEWSEGETDGLFTSPVEAAVVVDILKELRPKGGEACGIQILSPYNDQLFFIRKTIEKAKQAGHLDHMFRAPFDLMLSKRMGATVDEFQGSESDIVIVSLVRNNGLVPWKSIGFLKEPNRMNVLLSRARHKLIIVGSWQFFESRCDAKSSSSKEEYAYIGRMMSVMEDARKAGSLARYPEKLR